MGLSTSATAAAFVSVPISTTPLPRVSDIPILPLNDLPSASGGRYHPLRGVHEATKESNPEGENTNPVSLMPLDPEMSGERVSKPYRPPGLLHPSLTPQSIPPPSPPHQLQALLPSTRTTTRTHPIPQIMPLRTLGPMDQPQHCSRPDSVTLSAVDNVAAGASAVTIQMAKYIVSGARCHEGGDLSNRGGRNSPPINKSSDDNKTHFLPNNRPKSQPLAIPNQTLHRHT